MSEKNLSNEEVARIFAMYLGCECQVDEYRYPVNSVGINTGINSMLPLSNARLLLTPLSKISDEDAIEVAKTTGSFTITDTGKPIPIRYLVNEGKMQIQRFTTTQKYLFRYDVYRYLVDKGYAVPLYFAPNHWANGKTALELGIAVEK
jgi:hypothetical protein